MDLPRAYNLAKCPLTASFTDSYTTGLTCPHHIPLHYGLAALTFIGGVVGSSNGLRFIAPNKTWWSLLQLFRYIETITILSHKVN